MGDAVAVKPRVSIVLPTFNRAHVLPLSIRSVLAQTYNNFELIIVDDHSTDNTRAVVNTFSDDRIRYVRNDPNLKLPLSLNRGFALSKGKYLTWTSDDNMYAENAIAKMVRLLDIENCDFVFADYFEFADTNAHGTPQNTKHVNQPNEVDMKKGNQIGACFMYTRTVYESVGLYDPELFLNEDYDYFMRIARTFSMCHIPEPLYYFRRNDESLYCSRFCEVKAGSVLVRYKNKYMNKEEVLGGVVDQIMKNLDRHNNMFIRGGYKTVKSISYRLTNLYKQAALRYLTRNLRRHVEPALSKYDKNENTFQETKLVLSNLMNRAARIEYR